MKNKHLYLIFFITLSIFSQAQENLTEDYSYKRFEGSIGGEINITAHLVQVINQIYGNYRYSSHEDPSLVDAGKTIELNGELYAGDSARLKEFGSKEFVFTGKLESETYSGVWNNSDEELPFKMYESYPDGSLNLEVHYLHSETLLLPDSANSPSAEIELLLLYPNEEAKEDLVLDSVKASINNNFFSRQISGKLADTMLINFEKEYFENYISQNREYYNEGASFNWEKMITMSVVFNSGHVLCLEYLMYAYTGGAHGMTKVSYSLINLEDGGTLDLEKLFVEGSNEELNQLLTEQVREDLQIPHEIGLVEAGLFNDTIEATENIYVNGYGIGFLFNHYEIAPYSFGTTNVLLSWQKIKHLLRENSPVFVISKSI